MSKDKLSELIAHLNNSAMSEFESFSSSKKARSIYKHFVDYYSFQEKAYRAKLDTDKDRFGVEEERHFSLAVRQLKSLSDIELRDYLNVVIDHVKKIIEGNIDKKLLFNKMLFGTILRQLPDIMSEENEILRNTLVERVEEFDNMLER